MNHVEIMIRQSQQLSKLQDRQVRRNLQDNLLRRRGVQTVEPQSGGRRRPALDVVAARRRRDERVVVSAAELLVQGDDGAGARDELVRAFNARPRADSDQFQVHDVCDGIQRVVLPDTIGLDEAIDHLAGTAITASANHVAMMGGTAKGGATPKATTKAVETESTAPESAPAEDAPLVIVIDTGIDQDASLRGDGWVNFVTPATPGVDVDPLDVLDAHGAIATDKRLDLAAGHGTFVAGVIGQVAPTAEVLMLRAITTDGVCTEDQLVDALCRAAQVFKDRGLDHGVVNLSLGLESVDDEEPPILRAALDLLPPDVIVVAAAGNAKTGVKLWPAASDRVCGVASLANDRYPSSWSNCGTWVDFSARGEGVISTFVVGTETAADPNDVGSPFDLNPDVYAAPDPLAVWSGTSFSTPQIAGRFADILAANPNISRPAAIQELQSSGSFLRHYGYRVPTL